MRIRCCAFLALTAKEGTMTAPDQTRFTIDETTWAKQKKQPVGVGYDERPAGIHPTAIVIHSTNGHPGSTFAAEANFLLTTSAVSAHYLVGKEGQIAQILPPEFRAWHAGESVPAFNNTNSIGIENHHAVGDDWPAAQRVALTWLVQRLLRDWRIPAASIATHRAIALPQGRKVDPSDWSDADFAAWRDSLTAVTAVAIPETQAIIGGPHLPTAQLRNWLDLKAGGVDEDSRDEIACAYTTYGRLTRIGNLLPLAQAWHETGGFTSERWVKSFNPAGLGATNDGAWGATFASPAEGIVAQYAHLLAYAADDTQLNLPQRTLVLLDPRLQPLTQIHGRGSAARWIDLNGRWAVPGPTYGQAIITIATQIANA
jgi:N-acetyl-anhydromuramyl-L-alanine amidase AmpD